MTGSGPESGVLGALHGLLGPIVAGAGFVLADASPATDDPEAAIGFLEYQDADRLLLGLYEHVGAQMIVGELWSADHLRATPARDADAVALRRGVWRYELAIDPDALAREVTIAIAGWLTERGAPAG